MDNILEIKGISMSFPGVKALDNVSMSVAKGEVHALCGENGAGKSTLIKVLMGINSPEAGTLILDGKEIHIKTVTEAQNAGLSCVFQELNMVPFLSVSENIFLGRYPKNRSGVDWKKMHEDAGKLVADMGLDIDVRMPLNTFGTAHQQMISIARATYAKCKIIILDEPTSSLDGDEVRKLFEIVRDLKAKGIAVIFVTHRLDEIWEICDRISILKDGHFVGTYEASELDKQGLIAKMVGHSVDMAARRHHDYKEEIILEVSHLARFPRVSDVSFKVRRGEILGLAGLLGAGRTETVRILFGLEQPETGTVHYLGKEFQPKGPYDALEKGLVLCTEDRRVEGIIPNMSVDYNIALASMKKISKGPLINFRKLSELANLYVKRFSIKTPSNKQRLKNLSGGNQQKVVLAKWMATEPKLIILDEPTRGIDVGAKAQIEEMVNDFADQGLSVILISSEFSELVRSCDRVVVIRDGVSVGELSGERLTEENISGMIADGGLVS